MKTLKTILAIAVVSAFTGCANDDDYNAPNLSGNCSTLVATKQVSDIVALSAATYKKYDADDIIEAYVTSSDEGGNFYKALSLVSVDGTVGFSIPIDSYNIFNKFEPGRKVYIHLKDKYFVTEFNATVIGSLFNNYTPDILTDDEVGRISGVEFEKVITRSCDKVDEEQLVNHITIAEAKSPQYLNKLIEFDNVQFTDESNGKKYFDASLNSLGSATNHHIVDKDNSSVILRVSEYATFATQKVPTTNGKIRGVMTKYNSDYQFMVRTINDIKLGGSRVVPVFEETFSSNFPNWIKYSVSGAQIWTLDVQYGNPGSCAKMSGYSNANLLNEDWLISPAIDLTTKTSATITYDTATKFAGNTLQALISTDYTGTGNPTTATWTSITGTLSPSTGSYVWTGSGSIDISAFTGHKVYIAYKYTSTTAAAATWEVDNVKIVGN